MKKCLAKVSRSQKWLFSLKTIDELRPQPFIRSSRSSSSLIETQQGENKKDDGDELSFTIGHGIGRIGTK